MEEVKEKRSILRSNAIINNRRDILHRRGSGDPGIRGFGAQGLRGSGGSGLRGSGGLGFRGSGAPGVTQAKFNLNCCGDFGDKWRFSEYLQLQIFALSLFLLYPMIFFLPSYLLPLYVMYN